VQVVEADGGSGGGDDDVFGWFDRPSNSEVLSEFWGAHAQLRLRESYQIPENFDVNSVPQREMRFSQLIKCHYLNTKQAKRIGHLRQAR